MADVRQFPDVAERVETGPVRFGDDWPGVFIRGDHAGYYGLVLRHALARLDDRLGSERGPLYALARTLSSAAQGSEEG